MVEVQSPIGVTVRRALGKTSWIGFNLRPMEEGTDERPRAAYMSTHTIQESWSQSSDTFQVSNSPSRARCAAHDQLGVDGLHLPTERKSLSRPDLQDRAAVAVVTAVGGSVSADGRDPSTSLRAGSPSLLARPMPRGW